MRRPRPESADSDTRDYSVAADVLLRQEPDEEEDEEEDAPAGGSVLPDGLEEGRRREGGAVIRSPSPTPRSPPKLAGFPFFSAML
jgi:hypothetical protein